MSPSPRRALLACAAVLALGLGARLTTWREVHGPRGIRLVETDAHYHVLRAERLLREGRTALWFDRGLAHPAGARILWPPGLDALTAAATAVVHGAAPSRAEVEAVAILVPVAIGLLGLVAIMAFAWRWLGPGAAVLAGLLGAVLPVQVQAGALGIVDQHGAEQLVFCAAALALAACASPGLLGPLGLAAALAAAPWIWQGSTVTTAFVVAAATVVHVARPGGAETAVALLRRAAAGCAAGGVALSLSMWAWGPPPELRSSGLNGLSFVHPVSILAAALGLAGLAVVARLRPGDGLARRALAGAGIGALVAAAVGAAMPGPVLHGLQSLRATDPWLRTITEFQPAFGSIGSFREDLAWVFWVVGPVLLAPALGLGAFGRRWERAPETRTGLVVLATGTAVFVPLFLARSRFAVYAAPFLVWWAALLVGDAVERAREGAARGRRWALALAAAVTFAVPAAHLWPTPFRSVVGEELAGLLGWLRGQEGGARRGVLAPWALGHALQYYASAPAVVTPFGTDVGPEGMRRLAAFYYAPTLAESERILREGDVGFVLLAKGLDVVSDLLAFAPAGAARFVEDRRDYWGEGRTVIPLPALMESVLGALYTDAPLRGDDAGGVPFLRLVYETSAAEPYKLFERVEGARVLVRGAAPSEPVTATVELRTNRGRRVLWSGRAIADASGVAALRVPYSTGRNGASFATAHVVAAGPRARPFLVEPIAVERGLPLEVDLAGAAAPSHGATAGVAR